MNKCKTMKNKFYATALIIVGGISTMIDGDATFLVMSACIGIPLFLAKENWIY